MVLTRHTVANQSSLMVKMWTKQTIYKENVSIKWMLSAVSAYGHPDSQSVFLLFTC